MLVRARTHDKFIPKAERRNGNGNGEDDDDDQINYRIENTQ